MPPEITEHSNESGSVDAPARTKAGIAVDRDDELAAPDPTSRIVPPATPRALAEKPLVSKLRAASTSERKNLRARLKFERVALLLQGGGALGAYQAGVYEALAEAGLHPDWVVGISIGAINAAIIAGNAPDRRVDRLRAFWEEITGPAMGFDANFMGLFGQGEAMRAFTNQVSAAMVASAGAPGFFKPRFPNPWFHPPGTVEATSYYDTWPLKPTLERFVDFDRINASRKDTRLSLGAVNVRSGNLTYFDSEAQAIGSEHVMASGALPPGFPAIEIEGQYYWDGGLVSNTPLQWLVTNTRVTGQRLPDALVFQVDLWNAHGEFPRNLAEVATRQKEIQYSSRTRAFTDFIKRLHKVEYSVATLLDQLPDEFKQSEEAKFLVDSVAQRHAYNLVHLIYRPQGYEGDSKDYEFSRLSMAEHWRSGYYDTMRALRHPEVLERAGNGEEFTVFDFAGGGD
jgi:NTE family protein